MNSSIKRLLLIRNTSQRQMLFLIVTKLKNWVLKMKKDIVEAIKDCQELELSKDQTKLRRKDLLDLPQFKPKKKIKSADNHNEEQQKNPYDNMETNIFALTIDKQQTVPFRYIQQALLKNHNTFSPYVRFNKDEGHFAVEKKACTPELIAKLQKEGLNVGQHHLHIKKAEGQALNKFWQNHGHHYNGIIDNLRKDFSKKLKQQRKNKQKNKKTKQFEFAGQKYEDINKLKSLFKNILCRNPNNTPLKEQQANKVKELLSYHDKYDEKVANFKHFVVDVNPNFLDTRCFFVVRNDGTREDFSVLKCINNIETKYSE